MNDSHTRETILLIAIILCGCFQTAQAGNFLSKKDSLALAKELSRFASEYGNHPSRNETLEHIIQTTDTLSDQEKELWAQKDRKVVDFIIDHPQILDYPDSLLEKVLDVSICTSDDNRLRYYSWQPLHYDYNACVGACICQFKNDKGKVETFWFESDYEDMVNEWDGAFLVMAVNTLDLPDKRVYLVSEYEPIYWGDDMGTEYLRAGFIKGDDIVFDIELFNPENSCTQDPIFKDEEINMEDAFKPLEPQPDNSPRSCLSLYGYRNFLDYQPVIEYNAENKEITIREEVFVFDGQQFKVQRLPPDITPDEQTVCKRLTDILEEYFCMYNQYDMKQRDITSNVSYADFEKSLEQFKDKYYSNSLKNLNDSVIAYQNQQPEENRFSYHLNVFDYNLIKKCDFPKFQYIKHIYKKSDNECVLEFYYRPNIRKTECNYSSILLVKERGNWYIDDFFDFFDTGDDPQPGLKKYMRDYLNDHLYRY